MAVLEGAIVYSNLLVLLSIGLTITYITTGVPNFAQGSMGIFGAYVALSLWLLFGVHPYYSLLLCFLLGGALGIGIYAAVLKPMIKKEAAAVTLMMATLAMDLILLGALGAYSDALAQTTGRETKKFIFTPFDFQLGGIDAILLVSIACIALILLFLFVLLYRTRFGIALRASMENPALAEIMGVNVEHTRIFSWFLSGSLAAVAGALLPFRQEIVPGTGAIIIISIFSASIVGGLGSVYGALIGGYVIGISESLITFQLSKALGAQVLLYGKVVSLVALIAALMLSPKGIVGLKVRRKKPWRRSTSSST